MRESFSSGRQWILILAGIAVLGALVVVFYQSRSQGIGSDDMQKLMNRLDAMDAKIQEQQQSGGPTMDPWGRGAATGGFRGAGPRLGSQPPAVPTVEQTQQDQARMRRELDALFAAQGPAPASDSVPQQVTAAFNSDGVLGAIDTPQSRAVQCRAGMCLIQGRFAPGAEGSDWATRMMLEVGAGLPDYRIVSVPQPDGGYELRIYASRPGQPGPKDNPGPVVPPG